MPMRSSGASYLGISRRSGLLVVRRRRVARPGAVSVGVVAVRSDRSAGLGHAGQFVRIVIRIRIGALGVGFAGDAAGGVVIVDVGRQGRDDPAGREEASSQ